MSLQEQLAEQSNTASQLADGVIRLDEKLSAARAALSLCIPLLEEDVDELLRSFTIGGDESTMDEDEAEAVARIRVALDAARKVMA